MIGNLAMIGAMISLASHHHTYLGAGLLEQRRIAQRGRDEFAERKERGRVVVGETTAALRGGQRGRGRGRGRSRGRGGRRGGCESLHAEDADETGGGRLQRHAQHARDTPVIAAERGVRVNVGRKTRILLE